MKVFTLVAISILFCVQGGNGQVKDVAVSELGTRFVVAFPPMLRARNEGPSQRPLSILVASPFSTTVTISSYGNGVGFAPLNRTYSLKPNINLFVPISELALFSDAQKIEKVAITITSDLPVSVQTYEEWYGNGELNRCLPVHTWGTEYHVMSWPTDRYFDEGFQYRPGFAQIISQADSTLVTITPTVALKGGPSLAGIAAGVKTSIMLNANDVFVLQNLIDTNDFQSKTSDMSGTVITATKPIAVVGGHTKGAVASMPHTLPPTGQYAAPAKFVRNNFHETLLPDYCADTSFVVVPMKYTQTRTFYPANPAIGLSSDSGDVVRIIATSNETIVYKRSRVALLDIEIARLKKGESFIDSNVIEGTFYRSSKPVLLAQYGKSFAKLLQTQTGKPDLDDVNSYPSVEAGMPCMQFVPPITRWSSKANFHSIEGMDNFILIACKSSDASEISIDSHGPITSNTSKCIPNTPYCTYAMSIGAGSHLVTTSSKSVRFMAWSVGSLDGFSQGRAYASAVGLNLFRQGADTISVAVTTEPPTDSVCGENKLIVTVRGNTGLYSVTPIANNNYSITIAPFEQGAMQTVLVIRPINNSAAADIQLRIAARSGEYKDVAYAYTPLPSTVQLSFASSVLETSRFFPLQARLKLTNTGQLPVNVLNLNRVDSTVNFTHSFAFPITLAANESAEADCLIWPVKVGADTFKTGNYSVRLSVASRCNEGTKSFPFTVEYGKIWVNEINFGTVSKDTPERQSLAIIRNPGTLPLLITRLDPKGISGPNFYPYDLANVPTVPFTIAPNDSATFIVKYFPNGDTGIHVAEVEVKSNAELINRIRISGYSSVASSVDDENVDLGIMITPHPIPLTGTSTISNLPNIPLRLVNISGQTVAEFPTPTNGQLQIRPNAHGMAAGTYYVVSGEMKVLVRLVVAP
ncbi:MAG: IgGFc-binding protein [Ignavibacteria bacterium]|nr:IgGFc-binding protein [Ignavibacteria bacterium]